MHTSRHEYNSLLANITAHNLNTEQMEDLLVDTINVLALTQQLNEDNRNQLYMEILKYYPILIVRIPEQFITHDMCLLSVEQLPDLLIYLPLHELQQPDTLSLAVKKSGELLKHVPLNMRNIQLCKDAVKSSIMALPYVPEKFLDQKEFKEVIDKYKLAVEHYGPILNSLPESKRDLESCIKAVKNDWRAVKFVPDKFLDRSEFKDAIATCRKEIENDWRNLEHAPKKMIKDGEFNHAIKKCHDAIRKDYSLMNKVRDELLTQDLCLEAVKKNLNNFNYIPRAFRNFALCQEAIKEFSGIKAFSRMILKNIDNYRQKTVLTKNEYINLCLSAVKDHLENFKAIHVTNRDTELCLRLVREYDEKHLKNLMSIMWDYQKETVLTFKNFIEMLSVAIERNKEVLDAIPNELLNIDFCMALVNINGKYLQKISENSKSLPLSDEQFKNICIASVKQNAQALEYAPKKWRNFALCLDGVSKQGLLLKTISDYENSTELTEEEFKTIMINAVSNNALALEHVPEKYRNFVIDSITPEALLKANYSAIKYFPKDYNRDVINNYLTNIEHIIIVNDPGYDREIRDSYKSYSSHAKRADKTILCQKEDLDDLFKMLNSVNHDKPINLVILGHAASGVDKLAGVSPEDITLLIKQNPNLERVTLLGCRTGVAKALDKEKLMAQNYQNTLKKPSGLVLTSKISDHKQYGNYISRLSSDKDGLLSDEVYILINCSTKDEEKYKLLHAKKSNTSDSKEDFQVIEYDINKEQLKTIAIILGNKDGKLKFPGKNSQDLYYRGGKSNPYLTSNEINEVFEIITNPDQSTYKFSKSHPLYKQYKNEYPFLGSATIEQAEYPKLLNSLQKKVVDAIQNDPDIDREIIVKGYTQLVHVDTKEKQMKTGSYYYTTAYKKAGNQSTFFSDKDNIDRKELKNYHDKVIANMEAGKVDDESQLKSIKFKTTPAKKK